MLAHRLVVRDSPHELRARVNLELAVDVCQVKLDRLWAEEERRCDVAIGLAVRDQARDLKLLLRQLLLRGRLTPTQGKPRRTQFRACSFGPRQRASRLERLQGGAKMDP